jgi:hypothetical protein
MARQINIYKALDAMTCRRACEVFVVADMAKPSQPEVASIILGQIEQLLANMVSWSNERVCLAVTDEARRRRFTESAWDRATVGLDDLAVWPRMGGLPSAATCGSAVETARHILENGIPPGASRLRALVEAARRDPPGIERVCRALPLIAVEYDVLFGAKRRLIPWALDDGSHRAVVLALISARKDVDVLIGMRKEAA